MTINDLEEKKICVVMSFMILYVACVICNDESNKRIAGNYATPSHSLQRPSTSSAATLLESRDDRAYIVHFGFHVAAFDELHGLFRHKYPTEAHTGRPRALGTKMVLALVLMWLHNSMKQETLGLIFGATAATISRGLRLGLDTLYDLLTSNKNDHRWRISWPTPLGMAEFNDMILTNTTNDNEQHILEGAFGFIDGLNIPIDNPSNSLEQNAYYNGWKSACFASQVLVFTPDGCICYVRSNCPGSWHDAEIASRLYKTLLTDHCPSPFRLVADSAFPCTREFKEKILSVPKKNSLEYEQETDIEARIRNAVITKHRQPAEWGMRSIQGAFGRLRLKLTVNKRDRSRILTIIWYLHNYRTRMVGINQTATVYHKLWNRHRANYDL